MRKILFYFLFFFQVSLFAQVKSLYDDTKVSSVHITMNKDSLNLLLKKGNEQSNHYFPADLVFDDGVKKDTVLKVGFRLRGNTSRTSAKKSFKVSFNEFVDGRKYQGVKKLNLNGSHNDPTIIREKLYYDIWNKAGNLNRRVNMVRLYINKEYKGLYVNAEEIDKEWLDRVYDEKTGNLYKCTYPADLSYINDNVNAYKSIKNNTTTRAYDLVTNELADDYTGLVELIKALNQNVDADFVTNINKILNVESVLKGYAIEVALGHWDNYGYNKNNYYLYHNQKTKKFDFITYDPDNSMGVDWLNVDWATRNVNKWLPTSTSEKRNLVSKLLLVNEYKTFYNNYLFDVTKKIIHPDSIYPRIDYLRNLVLNAAYEDKYKGLDYGYTNTSWENGFTKKVDNHSPYGLKPYFAKRYTSTLAQVVVSAKDENDNAQITIFPNPTNQLLFIKNEESQEIKALEIIDLNGRVLLQSEETDNISVVSLSSGIYVLKIKINDGRVVNRRFFKN